MDQQSAQSASRGGVLVLKGRHRHILVQGQTCLIPVEGPHEHASSPQAQRGIKLVDAFEHQFAVNHRIYKKKLVHDLQKRHSTQINPTGAPRGTISPSKGRPSFGKVIRSSYEVVKIHQTRYASDPCYRHVVNLVNYEDRQVGRRIAACCAVKVGGYVKLRSYKVCKRSTILILHFCKLPQTSLCFPLDVIMIGAITQLGQF